MAQFIPVNGPLGPEEPFHDLLMPFCDGHLISHDHLSNGRMLLSRLDVQEINPVATELAGGQTIYGDALLYDESEQFS